MRVTRGVCVVILLCLLIVSVPRESYSFVTGTSDIVIAQTPHSPINITSESDFISLGLPGDGSPANPYIIEDLSIESVAGESCISISGNISSSFVIRSCNISGTIMGDSDVMSAAGIYLGAGQGLVERCTFSDCEVGVGLENVTNSMLQNNTFETPYRGIVVLNSSNVTIERCEIRRETTYGVLSLMLENVSDSIVKGCIIDSTVLFKGTHGVDIEYCSLMDWNLILNKASDSTIRHNTLSTTSIRIDGSTEAIRIYNNTLLRCHMEGISLNANNSEVCDNIIEGYGNQNYYGLTVGGVNCSIYGNEISNFYYGLVVHSSGNEIHNNTIHDCSVCGVVMVSYSSDNRFYYNRVYNNAINANDDGSNNIWDDGIDTGNIWDDAWSAPYSINGTANSVDRYPSLDRLVLERQLVVIVGLSSVVFVAVVVIIIAIRKRKT